jgi:serine/threonine protein kinase
MALHDCGVLHGDIKPANTLVQYVGREQAVAAGRTVGYHLRLADLGGAQRVDPGTVAVASARWVGGSGAAGWASACL